MENKRILLKISGEVLGSSGFGLDADSFLRVAEEIKEIHDLGFEIAVVVGGGNIIRGIQSKELGIDRVTADYMGMVATLINSIYLQAILERKGKITRVMSAIEIKQIAEPYIRRRAIRHLEKGRIVIFAAGTGNPYFTTDTTAALRAIEINAEILLKATQVDGVYSDDPKKNPSAKKFKCLSFMEAINRGLKIMDTTAFSLCMENQLPVRVFNIYKKGNLLKVLKGEDVGTLIK